MLIAMTKSVIVGGALPHYYDSNNQVANNMSHNCNNDTIDLLAVNPAKAYHVIGTVRGNREVHVRYWGIRKST